jgi:hypothetical protein
MLHRMLELILEDRERSSVQTTGPSSSPPSSYALPLLVHMKRLLLIAPTVIPRCERIYLPATLAYISFTALSEVEQAAVLGILDIVVNVWVSVKRPVASTASATQASGFDAWKDYMLPLMILPLLQNVSSAPMDKYIKTVSAKLLSRAESLLFKGSTKQTAASSGKQTSGSSGKPPFEEKTPSYLRFESVTVLSLIRRGATVVEHMLDGGHGNAI